MEESEVRVETREEVSMAGMALEIFVGSGEVVVIDVAVVVVDRI